MKLIIAKVDVSPNIQMFVFVEIIQLIKPIVAETQCGVGILIAFRMLINLYSAQTP